MLTNMSEQSPTRSLEALLFVSTKPLSHARVKKQLDLSDEQLQEALDTLAKKYTGPESGIRLVHHDGTLQFVTAPEEAAFMAELLKQDLSGELTRPSVETLTIIAYRGPMTKPEIEQIRGVNCTIILRNLLMRGLIAARQDSQRLGEVYTVTPAFLSHLGVTSIDQLPDYKELHENEQISQLLEDDSSV